MGSIKTILWIMILLVLPYVAKTQEGEIRKVLFVGNSYTYFWNLPQQVAALLQSQNIQISTQQSTSGGVNLGQHWRGEKKLNSLELIRSGDFDVIILQDHSMRSIEAPDSLLHFGQQFGAAIREAGAQPYVYLTWARQWDPYMQQAITQKYTELARRIDARVLPVGLAWQKARSLRPGLPRYDPDGSHPSPMGTYLTACVIYGVLSGQSPLGLPNRIISTDKDGEKLYLNIQSEQDALFCQKVAEDILNTFKK